MENRFLEMDENLKEAASKKTRHLYGRPGNGSNGYGSPTLDRFSSQSSTWARPFAATDRVLVILIENGGVDLGIPALVDILLQVIPGTSIIPASYRQKLVDFIRKKIEEFTDNLLETAELAINRYMDAKPGLFGDVIILRDGTASYQDLKNTLFGQSRSEKIVDLIILTHGSNDFISVTGGIDANRIRAMKTEYGKPLSIRSVYMMNCVGSSLNQAWLDAGAKVSSGSIRNNYLPEPTMYFFWKNWKDGQTFENAATSAYRKTINLMNSAVRGFLRALPIPGTGILADNLDFEKFDFVRDSAPVIQGQRSVTIKTDNLTFAQTVSSSLATTVLPAGLLASLALSEPEPSGNGGAGSLSQQGLDLIKEWERFQASLYNDPVGHCTIGYGTRLHSGSCDGRQSEQPYLNGITEEKAAELLLQRAGEFEKIIREQVSVALNQNQFDALVSFAYDIGPGAFKKSTLVRLLNQGDYASVPLEMKKWIKARHNGSLVDLPGLAQRRQAEAELFEKAPPAGNGLGSQQSFSIGHRMGSRRPGYSIAQNPAGAVIAGVTVGDAAQIGLAAVSIAQAQFAASQGSFTLVYDKAHRVLTTEARAKMPGAQRTKSRYTRNLLFLGIKRLNAARADIIIEWEGNPYGEIGTPIITRNLASSTEWSRSSANVTITRVERIPEPNTDPRTWAIAYHYEGTYDPWGNGYFEFNGEFEVNAFGGLKFTRPHQVVSRSFADWALAGSPEGKVRRGQDVIVPVPAIPQEQIDYLRTRLP
jgi:GH24 family phage-related lysozyme (muramidase)